MEPGMFAFLIYALIGLFFLILGIWCFFAQKPCGFWANAEQFEVTDVKAYNKAMGKLWIVFALILTALGLPLLNPKNILPVILVSIVGTMFACIGMMVFYTLVIDRKYRKR